MPVEVHFLPLPGLLDRDLQEVFVVLLNFSERRLNDSRPARAHLRGLGVQRLVVGACPASNAQRSQAAAHLLKAAI